MTNIDTANIALFEGKQIRKTLQGDEWWFSVVDVVGALTGSENPNDYWYRMKKRVETEDQIQLSTNCRQLKLPSADGKLYETDCASTEGMFRIIQSIPSPKAEPFKLWLARVGYERIQEIADPELSINRARENWKKHGRDNEWIQRRMMGQETRNKLTDYWSEHGIERPDEFAILTNIIHKEWSNLSVKEHKNLKGLEKHNLRDHMTEAELIFTALAEMSTREIANSVSATGMPENVEAGKAGGAISKKARVVLEEKTGKKVVEGKNFLPKRASPVDSLTE